MKKQKSTKKVAKKATVKKQPAKKVAPKVKKGKVAVKVLQFEPDDYAVLRDQVEDLKSIVKAKKETELKLRKKNKALSEQVANLKQKLASKENGFLDSVTTGVGNPVLPIKVSGPVSPFNDDISKRIPSIPSHNSSSAPNIEPSIQVSWKKEDPFHPVVVNSNKGLLGNCCAVRY